MVHFIYIYIYIYFVDKWFILWIITASYFALILYTRNKNCHHVGYSEKGKKNQTAAPSKKEDAPLPCDKSKASPHSTPNGSGCATRVESPTELDMRSTPIANIPEDRGSSEGSPPRGVSQHEAADNRETNNMAGPSHKKVSFGLLVI